MGRLPKNHSGYIALISALVISAVLVIISVSISSAGFFSRFSVLDEQDKRQSSELSEACVNSELLRLAENPLDATTGSVVVGVNNCTVYAVLQNTPLPGQTTIQTTAVINRAITNLQVVVSSSNLQLVSWQELPNL